MKNRLIASTSSIEDMLRMIAKYFCGEPKDFVIYEIIGKEVKTGKEFYHGTIIKKATGKELTSFVVKKKKDRYRFERVTA